MNNLKARIEFQQSLWVLKTKQPENFIFRAVVNFKLYVKHGFVYKLLWRVFCAQHRSSRSQMFFKIAVLKIFAIFTGKHLCWSLFLIKLQPWRPTTLLLIDSNTGVFLPILQIFYMEHLWWLLVKVAVMKNSCSEKQLFRKKAISKIS